MFDYVMIVSEKNFMCKYKKDCKKLKTKTYESIQTMSYLLNLSIIP